MQDVISVVVPVYNVEPYLSRCVESIQRQTYAELEIILVDDGSTDNSGALCDAFSKQDFRIRVIHKKNGGLSDARNAGIDSATGKYITFIDSDDWVASNFIKVLYENLIQCNADVSACAFRLVYGDKSIRDSRKSGKFDVWESFEALRKMLRQDKGFTTSAWAKLYDARCFETIRYPYGKIAEDLGTTYRILISIQKVAYTPMRLYYYYMRPGSISNSCFQLAHMDEYYFALDILRYVEKHVPDLRNDAIGKLIGVCFHLYLSMNKEQRRAYPQECRTLLSEIHTRRWSVILTQDTPRKVKMACIASLGGMGVVRLLYYTFSMKRK